MARTLTALMAVMLIATPASTQTPQDHLEQARKLLRETSAPPDSEVAIRIAALQQDFNDFAGAYLRLDSRGAPPESDTSGTARQADWRSRYLLVETDLTALLDPPNAPDTVAAAGLDPQIRDRLQQVRAHLQTFYAATMQARDGNPVAHTGTAPNEQTPATPTAAAPQTPPQPREPATARTGGIDPATALQLLDRIQSILDQAVKGESATSVSPVGISGTTGGKVSAAGGKVTIDRGLLDEIRAELSQIRALLKQ